MVTLLSQKRKWRFSNGQHLIVNVGACMGIKMPNSFQNIEISQTMPRECMSSSTVINVELLPYKVTNNKGPKPPKASCLILLP